MYMSVLSSLSVDEKLDLIAKLPNSIRNTYTKEQDIETEDPFACYEGDWGGNMSAEEYADDLRKSRTFTRTVGTFIKYYKISQLIHTQSIAN